MSRKGMLPSAPVHAIFRQSDYRGGAIAAAAAAAAAGRPGLHRPGPARILRVVHMPVAVHASLCAPAHACVQKYFPID